MCVHVSVFYYPFFLVLTLWLPEIFAKNAVFRMFWRFSGWTWTKLTPMYSKRHLQHRSMPFFWLALLFTTFLLGYAWKSKFFIRFVCLFFFLAFPFSPFLSFWLQWLTFYWACSVAVKKLLRKRHRGGQFLSWSIATCSGKKFCSEFFTQLFEHFCVSLGLHWADHSDLGIIGKIFSSRSSWLSIHDASLVKTDDVRRGRKTKARSYDPFRSQKVKNGGFTLKTH